FGGEHAGGDSHRDPGLRLAGHTVAGATGVQGADALAGGLSDRVRRRRSDRRDAGAGALRLAGARHPFRGGAYALRAGGWDVLPADGRAVLLAAAFLRADALGKAR